MDASINISDMTGVIISEEFGDQGLPGEVHIRFDGDGAALDLFISYAHAQSLHDILAPYFAPVDGPEVNQ